MPTITAFIVAYTIFGKGTEKGFYKGPVCGFGVQGFVGLWFPVSIPHLGLQARKDTDITRLREIISSSLLVSFPSN